MTKEEVLIAEIKDHLDSGAWKYEACYLNKEDLEVIVKALEREPKTEPCEDCISRQKVIELAKWFELNLQHFCVANLIDEVENMPTVTLQEPKTGWIPVSERLPEEDGQYLVIVKYKPEANYESIYAECGEWVEGKWDMCCFGGHCGEVEGIIAWQPLPEPYKEG